MSDWKYSIGEVYRSDEEECFWIFPAEFFLSKKLRITSTWFSHEGETWRFVKTLGDYDTVELCLWKKPRRSSPNLEYDLEVHLKSLIGDILRSCHGTVNSDYGCKSSFCSFNELNYIGTFISCGLMKLTFTIRKRETVPDSLPSIEPPLIDEVSESDEEPEEGDKPDLKGVDRLLQNLKHLMHDDQSSDVLLKIEDREFRVHKAILKVRSPVFASMFKPNTKESSTGVVDIPDCSADAFEIFLSYIYTGSADTISSDNVVDVYYAADKYQVSDLKSECVEFMEKKISVDNFCEILTLTLKHSEFGLQKAATRFFCSNVKTIIKTVQWQKYLKDNPTQANELYIKAINA